MYTILEIIAIILVLHYALNAMWTELAITVAIWVVGHLIMALTAFIARRA